MPVRKPIFGEIDLSSGFGVRIDPFLGRPAMHTGLDFRSSIGDPVRATANGTVETAGWNGGYGKMVEIDHGNGFSTRYGHLSEIEVKVGQIGEDRPDHRPRRLDRALDRAAPALRDAHRRRRGRSAEIPARRNQTRQRASVTTQPLAGGPFIIGEFAAHDLRFRFENLNHVPSGPGNPQRAIEADANSLISLPLLEQQQTTLEFSPRWLGSE